MERSRKIMYAVIIGIFVVSAAVSGAINFRRGIYIGDRFFYKSGGSFRYNNDNVISIHKDDEGADFTILLNGEQSSADLRWSGDKASLIYDDGNVINGEWHQDSLIGDDGMPLKYSGGNDINIHIAGEEKVYVVGKGTLSDALCRIDKNQTELRGSVFVMILGCVLYLMGALKLLFPDESHFFMRGWAYREQKLSDEGIAAEKIGGVIVMLVGIAAMCFYVFLI